MENDEIQKLKRLLQTDSYKDKADRRSLKHLLEEFLYSFIIALVPGFISVVLFISKNMNAPLHEAGRWLLWSVIISTALVFIFRQVASKKFLKWIAFLLLGGMTVFVLLGFVTSGVVCTWVGGNWGYYHDYQGVMHDIHGNLVTQIGPRAGFIFDTVCYIPQEKVPSVSGNKSFFYGLVTFIARN